MKNTLLFSFIVVLLLCFTSCKTSISSTETSEIADEETFLETVSTEFTETSQDEVPEMPSTNYTDIYEFLSAVLKNDSNEVNSTQTKSAVIVPMIKSSKYTLYTIELHSNGYNYFYYYVPVKYDKPFFDYTDGIVVCWSDMDNTFESVIEQLDLKPRRGLAYDESRNTWYIDKDGKRLSVAFPASLPVTTEEELYSYFDFEEYSASGNSGEVQ